MRVQKYLELEILYNGRIVRYCDICQLDKWLFKTTDEVNGNIYTILSGLTTSLSINLLTNFMDLQYSETGLILFSLFKVASCLLFNTAFVLRTIKMISLSNKVDIPLDLLPNLREQERLKTLFCMFYENRWFLRVTYIFAVIFGALTITGIVLTPFLNFEN